MINAGLAVPFLLSFMMIFFALKAGYPVKNLQEVSYMSPGGPAVFQPDSFQSKVVLLFSLRCPFCMSYINQFNQETGSLPDCQYAFFTTDKDLFDSPFFGNWNALRSDERFTMGILDISTAYRLFGEQPLPHTFIFDNNNLLICSLRGERNVRDLRNKIPEKTVNR